MRKPVFIQGTALLYKEYFVENEEAKRTDQSIFTESKRHLIQFLQSRPATIHEPVQIRQKHIACISIANDGCCFVVYSADEIKLSPDEEDYSFNMTNDKK